MRPTRKCPPRTSLGGESKKNRCTVEIRVIIRADHSHVPAMRSFSVSMLSRPALIIVSLSLASSLAQESAALAQRSDAELKFDPFTLCQLLNSRGRLSGRKVLVRGEVVDVRDALLADPEKHSCGLVAMTYPEDSRVRPKPGFNRVEDEGFARLREG